MERTTSSGCCRKNVLVSIQVDSERFLAKQVFSGFDRVDVHRLMQVVRHRAVDGVNFLIVQEIPVIGAIETDRGKGFSEPVERGLMSAACGGDGRSDIEIKKMTPACHRGSKFAPHQATTNDAKADLSGHVRVRVPDE